MRRIVYIAALALALVSCTAVKETAEPVVREKTPAERVDSALLASVSELLNLRVRDFLECVDILIGREDSVSCDGYIAICKNGNPIVSARFGLDMQVPVVREIGFGGRVAFVAACGLSFEDLRYYVAGCLECKSEEQAVALVECFNSSYEVHVTLDGEAVGVLRMKTWEKEGKLMPAFVIDYDDGASCYLQLAF